ncbi:MAG: right-handed parallel beta-helix repeat-containing protein [Candidatus Hodarchaeales archaeon]
MIKYKAKPPKLVICIIILVITGFLDNSSMFHIRAYDDDRTIDQKRLSAARSIHSQSFVENQYIDHDPIYIDSNDDFATLGFPGSGTNDDPYTISGYSIAISDTELIHIQNTNVFFEISNNQLSGISKSWGFGISLQDVVNGTISNNTIHYCTDGIYLESTGYITIFNNKISDNLGAGIWLNHGSHTNLLSSNVLFNNGANGIEFGGSGNNDNTIVNNTVQNNNAYGITISSNSNDNTIEQNNFIDNLGDISQATDDGSNNVFAYNYWNDWTSPDSDTDGIVDNPYPISGSANNKDYFSVTYPHSLPEPSHADQYYFLEAWDTGHGQDIVIDGSGNVYKTNQGSGVDIYDSNGNYITTWTGGGVFSGSCGLIFDSQWNLYVVNEPSKQIVKLDSQSNFVLSWGSEGESDGQFKMPNRIACDSQNNIYVADNGLSPNRIQKFDSNGSFIKSWNLPYDDGGGCIGLAIDSQDFVYVAAEYFLKYDVDGNLIKEWGTPLTSDGRLSGPHGLAVDSLDALYLNEIGIARVQKFDSDGVFITEFGQGQLDHPLGVTVAANGLVYVMNAGKGLIQIYAPEGYSPIIEPTSTSESSSMPVTPDLPFFDLIVIIAIALGTITIFGFITWRYQQSRKKSPVSYSPPVPSRIEEPVVQKEPPIIGPAVQIETPIIEPTISTESLIPEPVVEKKPTTVEPAILKEPSTIEPPVPTEPPKPEPKVSEKLARKPVKPIIAEELKPLKEAKPIIPPIEPVDEDKQSLFSSIQYRVQDLIFEQSDAGPLVRLVPYSGSIKEILVEFKQNQIVMSGYLQQQNLPRMNLELKIDGKPRKPSWDNPWQDITLLGEEKIIKGIKQNTEIAGQLSSLGTALVKVESPTKGEISLHLTCNETNEAIEHAYSLIKDLQLFFDSSFH